MSNVIAKEHLSQIINKLERLEADKLAVMEDIKEVCLEAKSNGFDIVTIKKILKIRKMDQNKRQEEEELLDLYMGALGM
ncbi:MAG UNVERIFIED_CONTAM: DUF2312 domain-containing protein [Rickettsiaceae bacterium]|jgi:uncharacterized protein (UPF0335 family)